MKAILDFIVIIVGIAILASIHSRYKKLTSTYKDKVIIIEQQQKTIDSLNVQVENYKLLYKLGE